MSNQCYSENTDAGNPAADVLYFRSDADYAGAEVNLYTRMLCPCAVYSQN